MFFSKVKATPLKEKALTPEFLVVQLALECFTTIFSDGLVKAVTFSDISLFVGSQVVLSWIVKPPRRMLLIIIDYKKLILCQIILSLNLLKLTLKWRELCIQNKTTCTGNGGSSIYGTTAKKNEGKRCKNGFI